MNRRSRKHLLVGISEGKDFGVKTLKAQQTAPVVSMPMIEDFAPVQEPVRQDNEPRQDATHERIAMSPSEVNADGARVFRDDLLTRLADKGHLWPDKETNQALQMAGIKYHEDWYGSGMGGLQAIDYGKVSGGQGGSGSSMPASRMAAQARANYRAARAVMPAKYRKPVELILLEGQTDLVAVGKLMTGAASPHTARSVAIERLTAGLYLLAKHYGFLA